MTRPLRFMTAVVAAHLFSLLSPAQLAPSLLERAASGDATAMHLIGRAAVSGGKPVEAYAWFSLAAEYGVETAEKSSLFSALSPTQVTEAAQRIEVIRSTQLRGLPTPAKRPVARVVDVKRAVEETPVAPPAAAPAVAQPSLDGQIDAQKAQIAALESDLAAARAESSAAKANSDEKSIRLEAALAKAGQEMETLTAEIASLQQDRLRAEEARDKLRAETSAVRSKLETDLAAAQAEARAAKQKAGEATKLEAALAQAAQERNALAAEIAALRRDKQRAEESLAQMRAQPSLEGKVQEQSARIARLEADLTAAESETRSAKARNEEATARLDASLSEASKSRDALSTEIAALKSDKQRAEESLAQLRARPSLDGEVEAQKAQIAKLETDLAAARSEASAARGKVGELSTQLEAALAKPSQEKPAPPAEIATLRQDRLRAEQARDQLRVDFAAARSKLEAELAAARNEARVAKAYAAKLEADLAAARSEARSGGAQFGEATSTLRAAPSRAPALDPVEVLSPALPRVHTVDSGENLSSISLLHYGTPNRWREIFNANRDVMKDEDQLAPGMKLRIP